MGRDGAQFGTPDGKQPRSVVCAPEKPSGTTHTHILDHVTLRGGDLHISWRRFATPPPPEPEQQQAFPLDPPPPQQRGSTILQRSLRSIGRRRVH
jgi:hypothetical protein